MSDEIVRPRNRLEKGFKVDLPQGEIVVVDFMGDDAAVVQAARISYGKGTKTVREDRGLIRYLMRKYHTTPFEQCELKLRIRCAMDVWRQWIRHRTASVNEYSTRYSEAIDETATTLPGEWRSQASGNRQGSGSFLDHRVGEMLSDQEAALHEHARLVYEERLNADVAREQARKDLSLSTMTEAYWKIDLHNLLHFLRLRMDPHAQKEIRDFANAIGEITQRWVPMVYEAFEEYRLRAVTYSRTEQVALMTLCHPELLGLDAEGIEHLLLGSTIGEKLGLGEREWKEFITKVQTSVEHHRQGEGQLERPLPYPTI